MTAKINRGKNNNNFDILFPEDGDPDPNIFKAIKSKGWMFYSAPIIILVFIGNNYEVFIDPLATIKNSSPIITFMTVLVTVVMIYGLYALWNEIVMIEVSKDSIAFTCWREPYVFKMEEIESYDSKNYKWIKIQSEEGGSYKFYLIGKWSFYRNKEKMEAFDRVIEILESKFSSSDSV